MLVYFTLITVVLLGFCGLAIDSGRMEARTAQLQAAADDGALTAAAEAQRGAYTTIPTLVSNEVAAFLSQAGLPAATATVQQLAATGPYSNDYSTVQVTVTQDVPVTFLAVLLGQTTTTLITRAVAMIPPCVFFRSSLNPPSENVRLASTGFRAACPIYAVNNFVNDYFSYAGDTQIKITGTAAQSNSSGSFTNPPIYSAPTLPDPLAYLTAPIFSSCTYLSKVYVLAATISPGTYCGGITIIGASVTMNPGLYIIAGGMSVQAGSTLTGSGVTMYFTHGGLFGYGTFSLNAATMHVNAPTDASRGGIPGIVIFGDRNWSGGQTDFIFNNGATYQGDGIIYLTNTGLSVQGSNLNGYNYFGLDVAGMYEYSSNVNPLCNYASLPGGNPFHIPVSLVQ